MTQTNSLDSPVIKFLLALELDRRSPDGRTRTTREFQEHFFPWQGETAQDRIFLRLPREVRGPIIAGWGIRGRKAAERDDNAKIMAVVHDSFVAGDLDPDKFEQGLEAETVIKWSEPKEYWRFWRDAAKLPKRTLLFALKSAHETKLFDATWFFQNIEGAFGVRKGTDVLSDGLGKVELADWVRNIHASSDRSDEGLLSALGWEKIVEKTEEVILVSVLDKLAEKCSLVEPPAPPAAEPEPPFSVEVPAESRAPAVAASPGAPTDRSTERTSAPPPASAEAPEVVASEADFDLGDEVVVLGDGNPSVAPPTGEEMVPASSGVPVEVEDEPTGDLSAAVRAVGGQLVRTSSGLAEMDWGGHAPDPDRSRVEAAAARAADREASPPIGPAPDSPPATSRAILSPLPPPRPRGGRFSR